jgi:integrase/recombinase XerD
MNENDESILRKFERDCTMRNFSEGTITRYLSNTRRLGDFLQQHGTDFEHATKEDLAEFVSYLRDERIVRIRTMKSYFTAFNSFYEFLLYSGRIQANLIPIVNKRYLHQYKNDEGQVRRRKIISVKEMADFLGSILNIRDKAICVLFVKTGIRKQELHSIDISDIDWTMNSIQLKYKKKRSNLTVFFDDECARILKQWLYVRDTLYVREGCDALFVGAHGYRLGSSGLYETVVTNSKRLGIYDTSSKDNIDHFGPHNFRHCFTTYLLESGMKREYVQELRGDARQDAVDVYNHISLENLREAYITAMPLFGL